MTLEKTLIVSATPPGTEGTGEALLREICLLIPKDKLSFFVLESLSYSLPGDSNDIAGLELQRAPLPTELFKPSSNIPGLKELSLSLKNQGYWRQIEEAQKAIIAYGIKHKCKQVMIVHGSPTITLMGEAIARALKAPMISVTWDPHETTMQLLHFGHAKQKRVMNCFANSMRDSKSVAVASEGMKKEYEKRYGVSGIPLIRPVRVSKIRTSRSAAFSNEDQEIAIGFSGSLYSKKEFAALFEALSSVNWRLDGRRVVLKVFSNYFFFPDQFKQSESSIQLFGYRDQERLNAELAKCHIVYLPYWFDKERELSVRTCFPDKLGTYLASGVPILFHGPQVSTPAEFFANYNVGVTCHSLDHSVLLEKVKTLVFDESLREKAWQARNEALENEYSLSEFRNRIAKLFGVSNEDLLPISDSNDARQAIQECSKETAEPIKIGCVLDSKYSDSIRLLLSACVKASWKIAERPISLRLIGSPVGIPLYFDGKPASVEIQAGFSNSHTTKALSECTLNFIPSGYEKANLLVYTEAMKPLLAHLPNPHPAAASIEKVDDFWPAVKRLLNLDPALNKIQSTI